MIERYGAYTEFDHEPSRAETVNADLANIRKIVHAIDRDEMAEHSTHRTADGKWIRSTKIVICVEE